MRRGVINAAALSVLLIAVGSAVLAGDNPSSSTQPRKDDGRAAVKPPSPGPLSLFPQHLPPIADTSQAHLSAGPTAKALLSNRAPQKPKFAGKTNVFTHPRQGGDKVEDAFVIAALPFSDIGTTEGYGDDYFEDCPYVPGSPDVVYRFHADSTAFLQVSLCGSYYDTRLWVYENAATPGTTLACNDDNCSAGLGSQVSFTANPGTDYYIVVDGYNGAYGQYQLDVTATYPHHVECPPGAIAEGEVCIQGVDDNFNAGCNSDPATYGSVNPGDILCGTAWSNYDLRDTDWYLHTFDHDTLVVWKVVAGFPALAAIINVTSGCYYDLPSRYSLGEAGDTVTVTWRISAGSYAFFVAPRYWSSEYDCSGPNSVYFAWMECQTPPPAPANDYCDNAEPIGDVSGLEFSTVDATWDGYGWFIYDTPDIWYCYTASCDGTVTVDLCDVNYDSKVVVWDGCTCPPFYDLASSDDYCGYGSKVTFQASAGRTYLIQVGGCEYNGMPSGVGRLSVHCQPAPPNSFCQNVTPVTLPAKFEGDATGAINTCSLFWEGQVWHAFTIDTCMNVYLTYCGTSPARSYNAWAALVKGCPCSDYVNANRTDYSSCGDGNVTMAWYQLKPGTYYYPVMDDPYYPLGPYHIEVYGDTVECTYCQAMSQICDEHIARVTLGTLDNSSACDHYADYTNLSARIYRSTGNTLTVENGSSAWGSDYCVAWIDWDHDLDFYDWNESVYFNNSPGKGPYIAQIYVPWDALPGPTTMRIAIAWSTWPSPCDVFTYGEVEDYTVVVDEYLCGDIDGNKQIDMNDITCLVDYYSDYGPGPIPWQAGDCNCDGIVDLADIEALVQMLETGYVPPCCPVQQGQEAK